MSKEYFIKAPYHRKKVLIHTIDGVAVNLAGGESINHQYPDDADGPGDKIVIKAASQAQLKSLFEDEESKWGHMIGERDSKGSSVASTSSSGTVPSKKNTSSS